MRTTKGDLGLQIESPCQQMLSLEKVSLCKKLHVRNLRMETGRQLLPHLHPWSVFLKKTVSSFPFCVVIPL